MQILEFNLESVAVDSTIKLAQKGSSVIDTYGIGFDKISPVDITTAQIRCIICDQVVP